MNPTKLKRLLRRRNRVHRSRGTKNHGIAIRADVSGDVSLGASLGASLDVSLDANKQGPRTAAASDAGGGGAAALIGTPMARNCRILRPPKRPTATVKGSPPQHRCRLTVSTIARLPNMAASPASQASRRARSVLVRTATTQHAAVGGAVAAVDAGGGAAANPDKHKLASTTTSTGTSRANRSETRQTILPQMLQWATIMTGRDTQRPRLGTRMRAGGAPSPPFTARRRPKPPGPTLKPHPTARPAARTTTRRRASFAL